MGDVAQALIEKFLHAVGRRHWRTPMVVAPRQRRRAASAASIAPFCGIGNLLFRYCAATSRADQDVGKCHQAMQAKSDAGGTAFCGPVVLSHLGQYETS